MVSKKEKYRLQPILDVKIKNKRQAEIELGRAFKALKAEEQKLLLRQEEKARIIAKRQKARHEMAEWVAMGESVISDSHEHLNFIRKLNEDEIQKDQEIEAQKKAVARAEQSLSQARQDYIHACKEVKIMEKHKELWKQKRRQELEYAEQKMMNELGNISYQLRRMSS